METSQGVATLDAPLDDSKLGRHALALLIDSKRYTTTVQVTGSGVQIRMLKEGESEPITVDYDETSEECSCKDWQFRHRDNGTRCKHLVALAKYELVPQEIPSPKLEYMGEPDENSLRWSSE